MNQAILQVVQDDTTEDKKSKEESETLHGVTLSESYLYKRTKHTNISIKNGTRGIL